jgi:hypothetical protein
MTEIMWDCSGDGSVWKVALCGLALSRLRFKTSATPWAPCFPICVLMRRMGNYWFQDAFLALGGCAGWCVASCQLVVAVDRARSAT